MCNMTYIINTAAAKSLQLCLALCDPIDSSPPGSCPWDSPGKNTGMGCHFLLQCAWKWKVKVKSLSHVQLFATPWTEAYQAPPPIGFSRQEYWSGLLYIILKKLKHKKEEFCVDTFLSWYISFTSSTLCLGKHSLVITISLIGLRLAFPGTALLNLTSLFFFFISTLMATNRVKCFLLTQSHDNLVR